MCQPILTISNLSIHSLIRGWPDNWNYTVEGLTTFNSQPHTRLTMIWLCLMSPVTSFNSQPHTRLTISFHAFTKIFFDLSIHSLIRGWPRFCIPVPYTLPFQFTASYEADQYGFLIFLLSEVLSIHSLIRGWPFSLCHWLDGLSFQFTASYEADLVEISNWFLQFVFQFTASYEADRLVLALMLVGWFFQFTASYEADHERFSW